jgi:predicted nuclease with TOPRIM domain
LKGKLKEDFVHLLSEHKTLLDNENVRYQDEIQMLREQELELAEKLTEKDQHIDILQGQITLLNDEKSQLKEMQQTDRDDVIDFEKTRHEIEELHLDLLNRRNEKVLLAEKVGFKYGQFIHDQNKLEKVSYVDNFDKSLNCKTKYNFKM